MSEHFHYHYNMPGYLPESDPCVLETLEDAQSCMKNDVEDFLEGENGDCDEEACPEDEHEYHFAEPSPEEYKGTQVWLTRERGSHWVFTIDGPCSCQEGADEIEANQ